MWAEPSDGRLCAKVYVGGYWAWRSKWSDGKMLSMQICHLVIGGVIIWVSGKDTVKKRTRDRNLKDTLLSHEMSWQENHPKYFWHHYFLPDLRWKHILELTPHDWYLCQALVEPCNQTPLMVESLTNWLKGCPSWWVQIGWAISGIWPHWPPPNMAVPN